jgi:hypothetical protein
VVLALAMTGYYIPIWEYVKGIFFGAAKGAKVGGKSVRAVRFCELAARWRLMLASVVASFSVPVILNGERVGK